MQIAVARLRSLSTLWFPEALSFVMSSVAAICHATDAFLLNVGMSISEWSFTDRRNNFTERLILG